MIATVGPIEIFKAERPDRAGEHAHQCWLMTWANAARKKHPQLRWLFAVPNGGARSAAAAGKLKAEGVKPGVFDLCLPYPSRGHAGLWIEMKHGRNTLTDEQIEFGTAMAAVGHRVICCYHWRLAAEQIEAYLA